MLKPDLPLGLVIPESIAYEKGLLGAILGSGDGLSVLGECIDRLEARDFSDPEHQAVYSAALAVFNDGRPLNPIEVSEQITRSSNGMADTSIVDELSLAYTGTDQLDKWIEDIKRRAMVRRFTEGMAAMMASPEALENGEILDRARELLEDTTTPRSQYQTPFDEALIQSYETLENRSTNDNPLEGIPTNYPTLDALLGGLGRGRTIVVGAATNAGKSAFGLNLALNVAKQGYRAYYLSLEMTARELSHRAMANLSGIHLSRFHSQKPTDKHLADARRALERYSNLPITYDYEAGTTVAQLTARCKQQKAKHGQLDLVVVDYIQLMGVDSELKGGIREQQVTAISRGLKRLAMSLDTTVLVLAQLNRNNQHRQGKQPQLSDLRESGAIEQDADQVILLNRLGNDSNTEPDIDLIVAKNRQGARGPVKMKLYGPLCRFKEMQQEILRSA